jgi:hypothetical protein
MNKEILIASLFIGILLVTPFSVVARENTISTNLTEQPDLEGLVAQLRVVIDEILQKYGHIPIVNNLCNIILGISDIIGRMIYCIFLIIILIPLVILFLIFDVLENEEVSYTLMLYIFIAGAEYDLNCPPGNPFFWDWPFKLFYTLLGKNDISELVNDCPCLQEQK